jgi:hypothetical protein
MSTTLFVGLPKACVSRQARVTAELGVCIPWAPRAGKKLGLVHYHVRTRLLTRLADNIYNNNKLILLPASILVSRPGARRLIYFFIGLSCPLNGDHALLRHPTGHLAPRTMNSMTRCS